MIKCDKGMVTLEGNKMVIFSEFATLVSAMYECYAKETSKAEVKKELEYYFELAFKSEEQIMELIFSKAMENIIAMFGKEKKARAEREGEE